MHIRLSFTLILCLGLTLLSAQDVRQYNTQRAETPPRINGIFDDADWQNVEWTSNFVQYVPQNGEAPSQETSFAILYDDANLYIGIKCFDSEPNKIESRLTRRDGWEGDLVGVHLDSYNDKSTAFLFIVNAAGVKNDGIMTNDDNDSFDDSWDPIWEVKTNINTEGWFAEMKIPLSQLRFSENENQIWGLEMVRNVFRKDEWNTWQPIDIEAAGWVSLYGELHGINNIKPQKQIEIAPFVVSDYQTYEAEEGNPFEDGRDFGFNVGVDGKIGLTNDLILDFAINPDFGQVEADPSEVNLSAFESFFAEKRPFFIEGKNITDFRLTKGGSPWARDQLFYSRRLGRAPRGEVDLGDNEFADIPINTTILGAFKLTGKTQKGWSIGIIETITKREMATIDNNGERREESIEPLTNYLVARLQKDIDKGNTVIGGMFTTTNRDINNPDLLFLPKSAVTGGLDFTQYFKDKKYILATNIAFSHVQGDKEAILDLQESPRRYFQRPDADYLTLDPDLTSLSGTGGALSFAKSGSSGLRFLTSFTWRSPGMELNDAGFLRRANDFFQFSWVGYSKNEPFSIFRFFNVDANQWAGWDFGGNNMFKGGRIGFETQFVNFWSLRSRMTRRGKGISNTDLRGGPSIREDGRWDFGINISSNNRTKFRVDAGVNLGKGDDNSRTQQRYNASVNYRPINSLSLAVQANYNSNEMTLQYVDDTAHEGVDKYIFATINHETVNLTVKVDYSLTPDLSLQYYGSPFFSDGLYSNFKKITAPHEASISDRYQLFSSGQLSYNENNETYLVDELMDGTTDYSFDKPDFNFRQFRSNLVMRWEYTPGSVLFLVWSKAKTDDDTNGVFDFNKDWSELSKTKGRNVFLVKFSYRFRAEQWRK